MKTFLTDVDHPGGAAQDDDAGNVFIVMLKAEMVNTSSGIDGDTGDDGGDDVDDGGGRDG